MRKDRDDDEDVADDGEDDDGAEHEHRRHRRPLRHRQVGPAEEQQLGVVQVRQLQGYWRPWIKALFNSTSTSSAYVK